MANAKKRYSRPTSSVLTQVHSKIWTLEGNAVSFVGAQTNTRMTIAKLSGGSLWVHSPIAWSREVADFVESLGNQVSAIIAPNKYHYLWVEHWQARFPDAITFAEPAFRKRVEGLSTALELNNTPPELYANEIDQVLCLGNPFFKEAVFFHRESRTAIFTDLIINRDVEDLPFFARMFLQADGVVAPNGGVPRFYKWTTLGRRRARLSANKIKSWQPQRILFAHGRGFAEPAEMVINREFAFLD